MWLPWSGTITDFAPILRCKKWKNERLKLFLVLLGITFNFFYIDFACDMFSYLITVLLEIDFFLVFRDQKKHGPLFIFGFNEVACWHWIFFLAFPYRVTFFCTVWHGYCFLLFSLFVFCCCSVRNISIPVSKRYVFCSP